MLSVSASEMLCRCDTVRRKDTASSSHGQNYCMRTVHLKMTPSHGLIENIHTFGPCGVEKAVREHVGES